MSDWWLPDAKIRGWPYWVTASHNLIAEVHAVTTFILGIIYFLLFNLPPVLRLTWLTPISRSLVRTTIIPPLSLCPYILLTNRFNTLLIAHELVALLPRKAPAVTGCTGNLSVSR